VGGGSRGKKDQAGKRRKGLGSSESALSKRAERESLPQKRESGDAGGGCGSSQGRGGGGATASSGAARHQEKWRFGKQETMGGLDLC